LKLSGPELEESGSGTVAGGVHSGEGEETVFCRSANLLRDRVQCVKYMYRKLARGGVVKRRVRRQRVPDES
jgi:hypothetical protein